MLITIFLLLDRSSGRNDGYRWKRIEFVGGSILFLNLFLIALSDGSLISDIAKKHWMWGAVLALGVLTAVAGVILLIRRNQLDDAQMSRGFLEAKVDSQGAVYVRPLAFGIISGISLSIVLIWLVILSKTPYL